MKLYLVMMGLFTIAVPPDGKGPAEILFLDPVGHHATDGVALPQHRLRLTHYVGGTGGTVARLETKFFQPLTMKLGSEAAVVLDNVQGFVDLTATVGSKEPLELREDCAGTSALGSCTVDGKAVLGARLTLGGGRLSPVEADLTTAEVDRALPAPDQCNPERGKWTFRRIGGPAADTDLVRSTFNGALFEIELPADTQEVVLQLGDSRLPLRPEPLGDICADLSADGMDSGPCIFLRLENTVDAAVLEATRDILSLANRLGMPLAMSDDPSVDRHFQLVYPLLANPPAPERWLVPQFVKGEGCESPPGSRCVPQLVLLPKKEGSP